MTPAASFISNTTEPSRVGSTASVTAVKSLPKGVARSASVGVALHVAGGLGIVSPGFASYAVCSTLKPAVIPLSAASPFFDSSQGWRQLILLQPAGS